MGANLLRLNIVPSPPRDKVVQEQLWGISVNIVKEFLSPEVLAKYGEPITSDPTELADQPPDPAVNQPMSGPAEQAVNQPARNHCAQHSGF